MIKKLIIAVILSCIGLILFFGSMICLSQSGLKAGIHLAGTFLPGELSVDAVHGRLIDHFELKGFQYSDVFGKVSLDHFSFAWRPSALFGGTLDITSLFAESVHLDIIPQSDGPPFPENIWPLLAEFALPVSMHLQKGEVRSLTVTSGDEVQELKFISIIINDLAGEGNLITFGNCSLSSSILKIDAEGHFQLAEVPSAKLHVDYSLFFEDVPSASGEIDITGTAEQLVYEVRNVSPVIAAVSGSFYEIIHDLHWDALLSADMIFLKQFDATWPDLTVNDLRISGKGKGASFSLLVETETSYDRYQNVSVNARMEGEGANMHFQDVRVQFHDMQVQGRGSLSWEDEITWLADLSGINIDPAVFEKSWPGRINFDALIAGKSDKEKVSGTLDIRKLGGELRGYPLDAQGKITTDGSSLIIENLSARSGDSILEMNGTISETMGMEFSFDSPDLQTIWPDLTGSLNIKGNLSGQKGRPVIQFDIHGREIVFEETRMHALSGYGKGVLEPEGSLEFSISAEDIAVGETPIEEFGIDLKGKLHHHVLALKLSSTGESADIQFEGTYAEKRWTGLVSSAKVKSRNTGKWQLVEPASLDASLDEIDLRKFCMSNSDEAAVCLNATVLDKAWNMNATVESFPLGYFEKLQNRFHDFKGVFSGKILAEGKGSSIVHCEAAFATQQNSTRFVVSKDSAHVISVRSASVRFLTFEDAFKVELDGELEDGSIVLVHGLLSGLNLTDIHFDEAGFAGEIIFHIKDLSPVAAISYPVVKPSGTLIGNIKVKGMLKQPEIKGEVVLEDGKLKLPDQGISIEDITLQVEGLIDRLRIKMNGASAGGSIIIAGTLPLIPDDNVPVVFEIIGDNFQVFNLPEMNIKISPELQLFMSKNKRELVGHVLINEAYLTTNVLQGTVLPSKDVVIVHDDGEKEQYSFPVSSDINVFAGEKVLVNAFGLRGQITGQLHIISATDKPVIFDGSLAVSEGTYSIYGRQLQIVKGHLLYSGNPPDNPGIEVRAENTASGVTTGIQVSGFIQEPEIGFYSTPAMEQDEIIRRLLLNTSLVGSSEDEGFLESVASDTGMDPISSAVVGVKETLHIDDIKIESGKQSEDMSLVIGSWLTPKLYMSYGQNLLRESGSFNTKYDLGRGFFVETETGTTANGADLIYELER